MNPPLVSVVMPVKDAGRFLAEAIESILSQRFRDFEFIIIDYGSTDASQSIVARYAAQDARIVPLVVPPCVLPSARNAACARARGKYLAVMDADDISLPNRLACEIEFMENHPRIALLGGATEWIDANGKNLGIHRHPTQESTLRAELATHCVFWHPTVLMRKEAFDSVGGYRPVFLTGHDYDLELRLAERFECANLSDVILKYRIHSGQVSISRRLQQTLGILAAQSSAALRKRGVPDAWDSVEEISPAILTRLGVAEAVQESAFASDTRNWVLNMAAASERAVALKIAVEILESFEWKHAHKGHVADLWLIAARLYWIQGQPFRCFSAAVRAFRIWPIVVGRPFRPLLSWLRLVDRKPVNQGAVVKEPQ